jgi:hypothetical protein
MKQPNAATPPTPLLLVEGETALSIRKRGSLLVAEVASVKPV